MQMVVSLDIPDSLEEEIEQEIRNGFYQSKSEFIRDAIRRLLEEREMIEYRRFEMQDETDHSQGRQEKTVRKNLKRTFHKKR